MAQVADILNNLSHRPWELPEGTWQYYQEWNNVLFIHWKVPYDQLRVLVPEQLNLDSFEGVYYVSLVAFTMQKIRPKNLPSIKLVSEFHEINIRTYVEKNDKKGVYFLNIEAEKWLSTFIAKKLSGLHYEKSLISRQKGKYSSINKGKGFTFQADYSIRESLINKSELDKWLTERYCLYVENGQKIVRFDIHHEEWDLKDVQLEKVNLNYRIAPLELSIEDICMTHYSPGVKVISWKKELMY